MCKINTYFLIYCFLFFIQSTTAQSIQNEYADSNFICGSPIINGLDYNNIVENTKKYNPLLYEKVNRLRKETSTEADTIGTIRSFHALNDTSGSNVFYQVGAKLMAKGSLTQIWVDTTELNNNHVTITEVNSLLNALENSTPSGSKDSTKGIIQLLKENFGLPPDKDGDGLTDFLLIDIQDKANSGAVTLGYFYSIDQTDNSFSNKRDLLYVDTKPTIFNGTSRNITSAALSTLAHEFQHLIHYKYDKNESTFLNEGLSLYSEVFCGYPIRNPNRYFRDTNTPLFNWNNSNSLPDYSRAGIFTQYYIEQLGDHLIKSVINNTERADTSLNSVFQSWKGYGFNKLFTNWAIANYANSQAYDSSYGYKHSGINIKPKLKLDIDVPTTTAANLPLNNYSVEYIKLSSLIDSVNLEVKDSTVIGKIIVYPKNGSQYYDSINTSAKYLIPSFSSTTDSLICAVINLGKTDTHYDVSVESKDNKNYWIWNEWVNSLFYLTYDKNNRIYGSNTSLFYAEKPDYILQPIYSDSFHVNTRPVFLSPSKILIGTVSDGIWMSSDTGNTWQSIGLRELHYNPITAIAVNSQGHIYASSFNQGALFYKSTDSGATWINIDSDILNTHTKKGKNIIVDQLDNVYAFTNLNEIYNSKNGGSSWTLIDDSWDWIFNIAKVDNDKSLVAFSHKNGLFKRDFFFEKIQSLGIPKYWNYNDIAFHPANDSVIYVSVTNPSDKMGVYRSNDKGFSWQKINNGLVELPVISLAVDNNGTAIATTVNALHKIDSQQTTIVKNVETSIPEKSLLYQNYPNPFNPVTNIRFYIHERNTVKLEIYDLLGRKVESLVNSQLEKGSYTFNWDARRYSSGIYFYKLSIDGNLFTKKMLLLK